MFSERNYPAILPLFPHQTNGEPLVFHQTIQVGDKEIRITVRMEVMNKPTEPYSPDVA